ncbi:MAG: 4Fe-4S binding protein [Candidatus Gastranaerophilales bacterium]|nr:4Fe-4S binding protein [Candidatus Gastranaerophilales bacterium]
MSKINTNRRKAILITAGAIAFSGLFAGCVAGGNKTAKVNYNKCAGCGACVRVCPHGAIAFVGNKVAVDKEKCTGCGKCANTCGFDAITL